MQSDAPSPPPEFLVGSRADLSEELRGCDHAQTMVAYCPTEKADILIPLPCKQWSCRYCAEVRIRKLAAMCREAKPNRLLTLTVDEKCFTSPRDAFDKTRRQISELFKILRKKFGEIEYLRCTELTKRGWPHYHLLIRSGFLPHKVVCDAWASLTGARIVDLRQVKESFRAYTYLVKYLAKLHKIDWTERHLSYSKKFFPPQEKKKEGGLDLCQPSIIKSHPVEYVFTHYQGESIRRIADWAWRLPNTSEREDW